MHAFELIRRAIDEHAFTAAQLAVSQAGDITHAAAFGATDQSGAHSTTTETRFDFASVTKPFVAVSFMKLLSDDRIRPSSVVQEFIPELGGSLHGTLLVSHLLEHSSGQPRRFSRVVEAKAAILLQGQRSPLAEDERQDRIRELLQDLRTIPLLFPPGTRVAYTSLGYFLLGVIAERVSGRRLDELVSETVLNPLELASVSFAPESTQNDPSAFAATETCPWRNRLLRGEVHDEIAGYLGGAAGHAGLFGTATDLARFGQALLGPSRLPVPSAWVRATRRPRTHHLPGENRAWGWLINSPGSFMGVLASENAFGHTGFTGTSLFVEPELSLVIALLTNRVHPSRSNDAITAWRPRIHDAIIGELG